MVLEQKPRAHVRSARQRMRERQRDRERWRERESETETDRQTEHMFENTSASLTFESLLSSIAPQTEGKASILSLAFWVHIHAIN